MGWVKGVRDGGKRGGGDDVAITLIANIINCLVHDVWFGDNYVGGGQGGRQAASEEAVEDIMVRVGGEGVVAIEAEGEEAGG